MSVRAWQIEGGFGIERLAQVDAPIEAPGPGQVQVEVGAVSLNYRDLLMVRGRYNPRQPLPLVPCSDACGAVVACGPGVQAWQVGDRVMPAFAQGWSSGRPRRADLRTTLGGPLPGTLRTHVNFDAAGLVRAPAHLSDVEAATLPCAGVTAWRALRVEGRVGPGDTVLTLGTGGVSLFALQLGRMLGARVLVTSSQDAKRSRVEALGAAATCNYREVQGWGRWAREASGGEGVDLVVEVGGAGTLDQSLQAVRPGGTVAMIGVLDGVEVPLQVTRVLMQGLRLQGVLVGSRADLEDLARAMEAHPEVRPVVDRVFPFDEAPQAFEYLASQAHLGKVVVGVGSSRGWGVL